MKLKELKKEQMKRQKKFKSKELLKLKNASTASTNFIKSIRDLICHKHQSKLHKRKKRFDYQESDFIKIIRETIIKSVTLDHAIHFFEIEPSFRQKTQIITIGDYLTLNEHNVFFRKIESINKRFLYEMIKILKAEKYNNGQIVYCYNEVLTKFLIILKGTISLYLPRFTIKPLTVEDFLNYLFELRKKSINGFNRVEKKNEIVFDGLRQLKLYDYDINILDPDVKQMVYNFYIEEDLNIYDLNEGVSVNQMSILYNLPQNFKGIAKNDLIILSITKTEFWQVIHGVLEEEASKLFSKIRKFCYIFNSWSNYNLAQVINCFIPINTILKDIVYHQKDEADSFFMIEEGEFELYCELSFSELNIYKDYIVKDSENIIDWLKAHKRQQFTVEKILDYLNKSSNLKSNFPKKFIDDSYNNIKFVNKTLIKNLNKNGNEDLIMDLKVNEEELKNKDQKIKIKIATLGKNDFIGIEDALESKRRFYSVKCVSEKGIVNKIRVLDFVILITKNQGILVKNIYEYINKRKNYILERLVNVFIEQIKSNNRQINLAYSRAFNLIEKKMKKSQNNDESSYFNKRQLKNNNTQISQSILKRNLNENNKNSLTDRNNTKNINTLASSYNNLSKKILNLDQKNNDNEKENNDINEYYIREDNYKPNKNSRMCSVNILKKYKAKHLFNKNNTNLLSQKLHSELIKTPHTRQSSSNINRLANKESEVNFFTIENLPKMTKNNNINYKKLNKQIENITGIFNSRRKIIKKELIYPSFQLNNKIQDFSNPVLINYKPIKTAGNSKDNYFPFSNVSLSDLVGEEKFYYTIRKEIEKYNRTESNKDSIFESKSRSCKKYLRNVFMGNNMNHLTS